MDQCHVAGACSQRRQGTARQHCLPAQQHTDSNGIALSLAFPSAVHIPMHTTAFPPTCHPLPPCMQAAIPRSDLIQHLSSAGKLADVLASYATNVQMNFPVADATVLSTGGRARTAALANVGSLAGGLGWAGCAGRQAGRRAGVAARAACGAGPTSAGLLVAESAWNA